MAVRLEVLSQRHGPLLVVFQSQHASLTEYLKRFARRHANKDLLSRTFVAIDGGPAGDRVAGYFSLCAVSVDRASVARLPNLDRLPRFPIPGVLLARLAVDLRVQGQGLGRYLLEEALGLTLQLARTGPIAFRLFVTDAIDASSASFYEHFGLARLGDDYPCRMVLDLAPLVRPGRAG